MNIVVIGIWLDIINNCNIIYFGFVKRNLYVKEIYVYVKCICCVIDKLVYDFNVVLYVEFLKNKM